MANPRIAFGQQVFQFFLDKGLPPHQAAAIAGNMAWEGGGRADLVNPGDNYRNSPRSPHSFGIAQWNDRLPALIDFARAKGVDIPQGDLRDVNYVRAIAPKLDVNTQLEFAWNEMQGPESRAFRSLSSGQDVPSAVAGAISYHRPAGWTWANPAAGHGYSNRVQLAHQILSAGPAQTGPTPAPKNPAAEGWDWYGQGTQPPNAPATQPEPVQRPLVAQAPTYQPPSQNPPAPFGLALPDALAPQQDTPAQTAGQERGLTPDKVQEMIDDAHAEKGLKLPSIQRKPIQLASAQPMRFGFGGLR